MKSEYQELVEFLGRRFDDVRGDIRAMDLRLSRVEGDLGSFRANVGRRFDKAERDVAETRREMREGFAAVRQEMAEGFDRHDGRLTGLERRLEGGA